MKGKPTRTFWAKLTKTSEEFGVEEIGVEEFGTIFRTKTGKMKLKIKSKFRNYLSCYQMVAS